MKGTMLIIGAGDQVITRTELNHAPGLEMLKDGIGGGWIEQVPGFDSIEVDGEDVRCAAFCDEEGKLKGFPINPVATTMWDTALRAGGHPGLIANGKLVDVLCGDVVIVFGDDVLDAMEDSGDE